MTTDITPAGPASNDDEPPRKKSPLLYAAVALIGALLMVLLVLALRGGNDHGPSPKETTSTNASGPTSTGSSDRSDSPTPPPTPLRKGEVTVTCQLSPAAPKEGQRTVLTYTLTAKRTGTVGLGAEIYDDERGPHADGLGDEDEYLLNEGVHTFERPLRIPASLDAGAYEIDAELWPPNQLGEDGVETIAAARCADITIP